MTVKETKVISDLLDLNGLTGCLGHEFWTLIAANLN
jgi:hypothetical protein